MGETLTVRINADRSHAVAAPDQFETTGDFAVRLVNEGTPAHVHLRFDDALASVAGVGENNHFVPEGGEQTVHVDARRGDADPVTGRLTLVTGYGAEETPVEVTVTPESEVPVDEGLATPTPQDPPETTPRPVSVPVAVLALAGAFAAVAIAVAVDDALAPVLGLLVVALGVVVAGYLWT